jgi:hypothetical protein
MRSLPCVLALVLASSAARAESFTIYVAARDTTAATAAQAKADDKAAFWFAQLWRAVAKAVELAQSGEHDVKVLVAGKQPGLVAFDGAINAAKSRLVLAGGHCDDWSRKPFECPTELAADAGRPAPFIGFASNKQQFKELVISGFVLDAAVSNKYDAKSNSLLKGTSRTLPLLGFKGVVAETLTVSDNVFLNGANRAFELSSSAASKEATVEVRNNFFLNNVMALKVAPSGFKGNKHKSIRFTHNSVVLNWPNNPDATSSNVGALELPTKDCCGELAIEHNLFAHNAGGALQNDWAVARLVKLSIANNLFFSNAAVFGNAKPEAGAVTGKFGPNPTHRVLSPTEAQDMMDGLGAGNVVLDPQVPVALVDLGVADSSAVTAKKTVQNDLRGIFGLNKDGGTVEIKNYAPRMGLDLANLPFPKAEAARGYGVQRDASSTF